MSSNHAGDEPDKPEPTHKAEITPGEAVKAVKLGTLQGAAQAAVAEIVKHLLP